VEEANVTLAAISQNAEAEIAEIRGVASTLQAGSIATRSGLEARIADLRTSATEAAQSAATAAADADSANMTAVAFATAAAATQSAQETAAADQLAEFEAVQTARETLEESATANAALLATQEIALAAAATQIAQIVAAASAEPTSAPTARVSATATPAVIVDTSTDDARVRRDAFLRNFPVPLAVGDQEWSIADDPQFRVDEAAEASIGMLLINEAGERAILNIFFGNDLDRYAALAEQAIPALELTLFEEQPTGFPSPSAFGQNTQAYEAVWLQGTVLARVTLPNNVQDAESKLIALARAVMELLSST
jgi:hypothetical protein